MLFVPKGILTVAFLLLALIMNSFVSAMLWSIYIPALGETGRVSSINGILDCMGYIAAKKQEWESYSAQVSQSETDQYLYRF